MFPKYRHTPILDPERKRCPVCRRAVYSLADIHPQCAIKLAVARESRSKREAASKAIAPDIAGALGFGETNERTVAEERVECSGQLTGPAR
jgi:hypothetical protein